MLVWVVACKKDLDPPTEASLNQVSTIVSFSTATGYTIGYKDGPLEEALFKSIAGLAFDANDNLYVADYDDNRIRKITPEGIVSTVAGTGVYGLKDGPVAQAQFASPDGLVVDASGNLFVSHYGAIRKITPDGIVSTIAGVEPSKSGYLKYDTLGLTNPSGLCLDENQNIYVTSTDGGFSRVVKVTPTGRYSVLVGFPFPGKTRSVSDKAQVLTTDGVAYDVTRHIFYVSDYSYGIIKATPDGSSVCYSGCLYEGHIDGPVSSAQFRHPLCAVLDKAGNLYLGDEYYIRKITPAGVVSTVAGTGTKGHQDGPGDQATFEEPAYMAFDSEGNLYVTDHIGIRKITFPK